MIVVLEDNEIQSILKKMFGDYSFVLTDYFSRLLPDGKHLLRMIGTYSSETVGGMFDCMLVFIGKNHFVDPVDLKSPAFPRVDGYVSQVTLHN